MAKTGRGRKMAPMGLGDALKAVRGRVRQEDVAQALKVSQPTVSAWEKGTPPPLEKIPELEKYVGAEIGTALRLAGYVEGGVTSVEASVLADEGLTDDDRELVLKVYRSLPRKQRS